jgi:alpha,alpha-trehalose phosphorylase
MHTTRSSRLRMACAMDHELVEPDGHVFETEVHEDWARFMTGTYLRPGQKLVLTKYVSYGWSSQRSSHALSDQVTAALVAAKQAGWHTLVDEQKAALDAFWKGADVEIDGSPVIQQAVRFALFHTFQAGARAEQRAIPAKGLTGPGYDGHAFWDTESFVLPVLTATAPKAARDALIWRHSILELAKERAQTLLLEGATFPWRTIRGQECSSYWPAGTAAMHINADVAMATQRYVDWTGDQDFDRDYGTEILVETARLWNSLGYHGDDGQFHIDGVTGPDEYSAVVRDNVYTNLMAARNLESAAAAAERWPDQAALLNVSAEEIAGWRKAAATVALPYDEGRQLHQQDLGYTSRQVADFSKADRIHAYPMLLHVPYMTIYRKQVLKQADLVLALHWCGDAFSFEDKARAYAYYEALTVRDSSLSAATQAIVGAEVGQLDLALDYLAEAALMDLRDLEHNTLDGLHIASLAGSWLAIVAGFGGVRDHGGRLSLRPQLPGTWKRLRFRLLWRGARLEVDVRPEQTTYRVADGPEEGVQIWHDDEALRLTDGERTSRPTLRIEPLTPRPTQPVGRAPLKAETLDVPSERLPADSSAEPGRDDRR